MGTSLIPVVLRRDLRVGGLVHRTGARLALPADIAATLVGSSRANFLRASDLRSLLR